MIITEEINNKKTDIIHLIPEEESDFMIICFPGNPGIIDVYYKFLHTIFNLCKKKIEVYGVGYIGHSDTTSSDIIYNLEDQISFFYNLNATITWIRQL